MNKYYVNRSTQAITESHDIAMMWYREGNEVEVWKDGRCILVFKM